MLKLVRMGLGLAFGSWMSAAVSLAVIGTVLAGAIASFVVWKGKIYHAGELAREAVWIERVEKERSARDMERATAQIEVTKIAQEHVRDEAADEEKATELRKALERAQAEARASLDTCSIPESVIAPLRLQ